MRDLRVLMIVVGLAAALMGACSSEGSAKTAKLDEEDAGSSIELRADDTLEVILDGNPTTGFGWYVASADTAVLRQVGEWEYKGSTDLIGSPGKLTLHFEAGDPGRTTLKLVYHRPWEKDVAPARTFEATVVVK